jgi:transaldolase
MELYLDSVDLKEIETALDYGFIKGLTTTPTFMPDTSPISTARS